MSNLLRLTPRLSKKKHKNEDEKHEKSKTGKIMHEIKSHFHKDKNSESKKSKKKKKEKVIQETIVEIKETHETDEAQEEIIEVVNEVLLKNDNLLLERDSKDVSEISSVSDYSYDRLNDSTNISEFSSEENLNLKTNNKVYRRQSSASVMNIPETHNHLRKSNSLSRRNSTSQYINKIFRKSKTDAEEYQQPKKTVVLRYNSESKLQRKSSTSIKRRISSLILGESRGNLKRSSSIRDFMKKKDDNPKNQWSLQSLVENDIGVSYNDLSFVNYDAMNTCSYEVKNTSGPARHLLRSQSVSVQNVHVYQPHPNNRLSLASDVLDRFSQSSLGECKRGFRIVPVYFTLSNLTLDELFTTRAGKECWC